MRVLSLFYVGLLPYFAYSDVLSFGTAKKKLVSVYADYDRTIYCDCKFIPTTKEIRYDSCGFESKLYRGQRRKIEWEHLMPKSWYTTKQDRTGEGDMHNLYPSIGVINAVRSNKIFKYIDGEKREFGKCDFESNSDFAEPRFEIRGAIARTYLYMVWKYPVKKDVLKQLPDLEKWSIGSPPTSWECKRNMKIKKVQGNDNPFVTSLCRRGVIQI